MSDHYSGPNGGFRPGGQSVTLYVASLPFTGFGAFSFQCVQIRSEELVAPGALS